MNKTKIFIVSAVFLCLTAFAVYTIWLISKPVPLQVQGEIEATQVKFSSKLTGRIDTIAVKKGDWVKPGQLLYRISSPELEAKIIQAEAVEKAAGAQNSKAIKGAQKEDIQAAFNNLKKAEAAADLARKTYNRVLNLFNEGVLPEQKKDEAETQMKAAVETANAAKALYDKAVLGARAEDKMAAGALRDQARGAVQEVTSYLNETNIYATREGEVGNILAEIGELVPAGYPVVTLVDLNDVWATFYLKETLLPDIKKGDTFFAVVPAMGYNQIEFEVTYLAAAGDFATYNATKTSGDFDMRSFEMQAIPVEKNSGYRPGMSVLIDWSTLKK